MGRRKMTTSYSRQDCEGFFAQRIDKRHTAGQDKDMTNNDISTPHVFIDLASNGPIVHHHSSRISGNVVGPAFIEDNSECVACNWGRS